MKKLAIPDLAQIINAESVGVIDGFIGGVSIDSRTVKTGDCFFAVEGQNFDGHDYVRDALAAGAVCAVVSKDIGEENTLKVDDTIKALGLLAKEYRRRINFKVVAITGSVGKTTTRQIAAHVLSKRYRVVQSVKNFNNDKGLPLTLLWAEADTEIVIAELGANLPGEIAYLSRIAAPDVAVVTNVTEAHLEGFGDVETIKAEKMSIAEGLRPGGVLITDAHLKKKAENVVHNGSGSRFSIDGVEVVLPLLGAGNIHNALTAWMICERFGIELEDFALEVATLPTPAMRVEPIHAGTLLILNDCYNANPASMKNALEILGNLGSETDRRLVFICADMGELGSGTEKLHIELGTEIARAKVRLLLTVGDYAKIAAESAQAVADYDLRTIAFKDTVSACKEMEKYIKDNDIILVKGSRTAKLELTIDKLKKLFA